MLTSHEDKLNQLRLLLDLSGSVDESLFVNFTREVFKRANEVAMMNLIPLDSVNAELTALFAKFQEDCDKAVIEAEAEVLKAEEAKSKTVLKDQQVSFSPFSSLLNSESQTEEGQNCCRPPNPPPCSQEGEIHPQSCSEGEWEVGEGEETLQKMGWSQEEVKSSRNRRKSYSSLNKIHRMHPNSNAEIEKNLKSLGVAEWDIHNLTDDILSPEDLKLLAYGINFIPTPGPNSKVLIDAMNEFIRNVRLRWHFSEYGPMHGDPEDTELSPFHIKSLWEVPADQWNPILEKNLRKLEFRLGSLKKIHVFQNWHKEQNEALLRFLSERDDRLVITADKNLGYCYVSRLWYISKCVDHLANPDHYKCVTKDVLIPSDESIRWIIPHDNGEAKINSIYDNMVELVDAYEDYLGDDEYKWIIHRFDSKSKKAKQWTLMNFYILAKVHKAFDDPSQIGGRPIVPNCNWVTHNLSYWISHELNGLMHKASTVLKDSSQLVRELQWPTLKRKLEHDGKEIYLVSADVVALYPNIDRIRGMRMIEQFLSKHYSYNTKGRLEFLLKALTFILQNGLIRFLNDVYQQVNGSEMGSSCSPAYANIFMHMIEKSTVETWMNKGTLLYYKRFIDDTFMIIKGSPNHIVELMNELNHLDETIKFTHVSSQTSLDFLDIVINFNQRQRRFKTSVYQKTLNRYAYLPFKSWHTPAMKSGFIKGEAIRYARLCSEKQDFTEILELFIFRLYKRGYPLPFIEKALSNIAWENRTEYLIEKQKDKTIPLLFKIKYNTAYSRSALRNCLDQFHDDLVETMPQLPLKLQDRVTLCYKLPKKLHTLVREARVDKGF